MDPWTPALEVLPVTPSPERSPEPPAVPGALQVSVLDNPAPRTGPPRVAVSVSGVTLAELRVEDRHYRLPAEVPPDSYAVWADLGKGLARASTLVLDGTEGAVVITCAAESGACSTRR